MEALPAFLLSSLFKGKNLPHIFVDFSNFFLGERGNFPVGRGVLLGSYFFRDGNIKEREGL